MQIVTLLLLQLSPRLTKGLCVCLCMLISFKFALSKSQTILVIKFIFHATCVFVYDNWEFISEYCHLFMTTGQDLQISAERPSSLMVIPTKIKNIKKRQRRTDSTEESEQASQAPPQKQCTFRSNVLATVGLLSTLKLNNAHVALLKQTPFWLLIDAIRKGKLGENAYIKHDKPILAIIEKYDTNDSKFLIGGKKVALTRNDIRLIFGICCGNIPIGELKIKKKDVAFATRRGITEARIGSRKIKDMINELLNKEEAFLTEDDIRDVVRLICMFICLTLFFSTSGVTIAWTYVDCMENIEQIKDYDWAQSIADTLNASMHKFHAKPRDATGCVMALMVSLNKFFAMTSVFGHSNNLLVI